MIERFFMVEETALPKGRWFTGDFTSTDREDRRRLDRLEKCRGRFTIDPGFGGKALAFSLTAFGLPIATIDLAEQVVQIAGEDVHLVPTDIAGYGEYRFIQTLRELDCVDESRSTFETFGDDAPSASMRGEHSAFTSLTLDAAKIPQDAHFFHVARWRLRPIVSRQVRETLEKGGILGVTFVDVNASKSYN